MKRSRYWILGMVMLVGVMTGFVINPQQARPRFEYATVIQDYDPETGWHAFGWNGPRTFTQRFKVGTPAADSVLIKLGCGRRQAANNRALNCAGSQGWELVTSTHMFDTEVGRVQLRGQYTFKRRLQ